MLPRPKGNRTLHGITEKKHIDFKYDRIFSSIHRMLTQDMLHQHSVNGSQ